jgi:cytochrome c oxidase subunit IV
VADHNKNQEAQQGHEEGHHGGPGRYVVIWLLLLVLTGTTVFTGTRDLGSANLPLALFIATVKALLVILFFMHLWDSEGVNRLVFGVSALFVVVLLLGVFGDLLTRNPMSLPPNSGSSAHRVHVAPGAPAPHAPAPPGAH